MIFKSIIRCIIISDLQKQHFLWRQQRAVSGSTSAWLPGARVLLQRSQRRQGRCQFFPSDETFSAAHTHRHHENKSYQNQACLFHHLYSFILSIQKHVKTPICLPKYTVLLHRGQMLGPPEKDEKLAAETLNKEIKVIKHFYIKCTTDYKNCD